MTIDTHPQAAETAISVTKDNYGAAMRGLPFFFSLAGRIALRLKIGVLTFVLPDGRRLRFEGEAQSPVEGVIVVRDFDFARRVIFGGDVGFFESFADGQWETPDLADCLYIFAVNADFIAEAFEAAPLAQWIDRIRHAMNRNTRSGSRRNITAHYDLGNSFYERWLDRSMTYSSARFPSPGAGLAEAQANKYRTLAQAMELKPGQSVLEIGSGWGGFAEFAAKDIGAKVTGLTISPAQLAFAQERIHREGLAEKVEFRLQDYRDVDGQFDKIASIEMFEAVGKEYWPQYFSKVRDCLKPGGVAGLQIITIADRFFEHYLRSPDFIQRYVFPGGMLPSPGALRRQVANAGLIWRDASEFGEDYARTLGEWRRRFLGAWDDIAAMGFDDRFKKLWRYYLSYCEAGFRARTTDVMQLAISR